MSKKETTLSLFDNMVSSKEGNDHLSDIIASHGKIPPLDILLKQLTERATNHLTMNEEQAKACHKLV